MSAYQSDYLANLFGYKKERMAPTGAILHDFTTFI